MNKIHLLLFFVLIGLYGANIEAQNIKSNWELETPETGNKEYVAREYIRLKKGFRYSATGPDIFRARIDPGLLFPPSDNSYLTESGIITPNSHMGGAVGYIPGQFAVNAIGGATFNIPIDCPEGINNLKPNISIVYNSHSGNGYMGWGWSLTNVSAITRAGSTLHYDGKIAEIKLDVSDNFILDGQRLFRISGEGHNEGAKFRTEVETYNDVTIRYNTHMYFEVKTKDGLILEYGSSDDSRIDAVGRDRKLSWLLKRVTDQNGNYMIYEYTKPLYPGSGEVLLNRIRYTGNSLTRKDPSYSIEFVYGERPDIQYAYVGGAEICISRVIHQIVVKIKNEVKSRYELMYDYNSIQSKLIRVQLYNGANEKMNPTFITWNDRNENIENKRYSPDNLYKPYAQNFWYADFTADGRTDLITYEHDTKKVVIYEADGSDKLFKKWHEIQLHLDDALLDELAFSNIIPGDFDGDGVTDFVLVTRIKSKNEDQYQYRHALFGNKKFVQGSNTFEVIGRSITEPTEGLVGDFDGDGILELVFENTSKTFQMTGPNSSGLIYGQKIVWGKKSHTTYFPNNKYMLDFNGDGKTDIMVLDETGYRIYALVDVPPNQEYRLLQSGNYPNYNTGVYFADFNGDGKTDMLTQRVAYDETDNETKIHFSTGTDFVSRNLNNMKQHLTKLYPGDYNGDGRADLAYFSNSTTLVIGIFSGFNFIEKRFQISTGVDPMKNIIQADFNGDGRCELIYNTYALSSGNYIQSLSFGKDCNDLSVREVSNPLGLKTTIEYAFLHDREVYWTNKYQYDFPVVGYNNLLRVVKSYSRGNDEKMFKTEMKYTHARIHRFGKGFLGFNEVSAKDVSNDIVTTTSFGYDTKYYGIFAESQIVKTTSGKVISSINYENQIIESGKSYFPYVCTQTQKDELTGLVTSVKNEAYVDGSPTSIIKTKGNWTEQKNITYTKSGSWCNNKIKTVETRQSQNGEVSRRHAEYFYDSKGNLLKEDCDGFDRDKQVVTSYEDFDNLGRSRKIVVRAKGENGTEMSKTSTITYTSSGDYIRSRTNNLNETLTYNWDENTGLLGSETNPWGEITVYKYNNWGQLQETIYPDRVRKTQVSQWASSDNHFGAKYFVYSEDSGSSPVWTWYDSFGREVGKQLYGLNARLISVFTEYDHLGRKWRVSEPTFSNTPQSWAEIYQYDIYGRPVSITTPMGEATTLYNGTSTTVTTPKGSKTTSLNAAGQVESITTNSKTVTYSYYPTGKIKSATPQDGPSLYMYYDLHGNRTKLIDPDAGTVRAEYNGFGDITLEVQKVHSNQDSIQTGYQYDPNCLLKQMNRNGEITLYTYDNDLGYKSRIKSLEIAGKHRQTFTYDRFSRIVNIREEFDGRKFDKSKEYDFFGRVTKEYFPSGFHVVNSYDKYGHPVEVKDPSGQSLWKAVEENARGQLVNVGRGGKLTTLGYDDRGFPTSIVAEGVQNMSYLFNSKGNPDYRIDNLTGQKETFAYDGLDRLTDWNVFKAGVQVKQNSIVYNRAGNIARKSDLGNFLMSYGQGDSKPHALTSISGIPDNFPVANLKMTYTDFKKIESLQGGSDKYTITYGVDNQRRKSVYKVNDDVLRTKYYLGNYEEEIDKDQNIRKIHYLAGGAMLIDENNKKTLYYGYSDYQGSLLALTDAGGQIVSNGKFAYDPWGQRRDPQDWTQPDKRSSRLVERGFTGHEHLDMFRLINMNGRVYDPLTSGFLSPDPFVQAPDNWMNFNRYSYCLNNPLVYNDPSGELLVPAIVFGAFINLAIQANLGNVNSTGDMFLSMAVGGLSGAAGYGAGFAFSSGMSAATTLGRAMFNGTLVGAASGFAGSFVGGAGNAWIQGAGFEGGLQQGFLSGSLGMLTGGVMGSINGAIGYDSQKTKVFQSGCTKMGITPEERVPATDEYLLKARSEWFPEAPTEYIEAFTTENIPEKHLTGKFGLIPNNAPGKTEPISVNGKFTGKSRVYFNRELAFTDASRLFQTMGHELMHVSQFSIMAGQNYNDYIKCEIFMNMIEFHAYGYEQTLGGKSLNSFNNPGLYIKKFPDLFPQMSPINFKWTFNYVMP